jgi:hypothetical protein
MKKYSLILMLLVSSLTYSQNLSIQQMEDIATAQLLEMISYFENHELPITSEQREQLLSLNIIVQDKVNSIKAHPENTLEPNELEEAIIYRNNHRINATKRILSNEQVILYNQFYPSSEFNHPNFQL